jgi:hypothetical protein
LKIAILKMQEDFFPAFLDPAHLYFKAETRVDRLRNHSIIFKMR